MGALVRVLGIYSAVVVSGCSSGSASLSLQGDASGDQTGSGSGGSDGSGRVSSERPLTASTGILVMGDNIVSIDPSVVPTLGANNTLAGNNVFSGDNQFSGANSFSGNNSFSGANSFGGNNSFSGDNSFGGNNTFTGVNVFSNPGNSFSGGGAGLTGLNASALSTGQIPPERLSGAYAGISSVGPLSTLSVTGTAAFSGAVSAGSHLAIAGNLDTQGDATVQGDLAVEGSAGFLGQVDFSNQPSIGFVPSVLTLSASFANATHDVSGTGTVTPRDGSVVLNVPSGTGSAEIRSCDTTAAMGFQNPGAYLSVRAHVFSLDAAADAVTIMFGRPTGAGNNSGGFGFRYVYSGGQRVLQGVTFGTNATLANSMTLVTGVGTTGQKLLAVRVGSNIQYYVDGVARGSLATTGMSALTFCMYSASVSSTNGVSAIVSYLSLGQP